MLIIKNSNLSPIPQLQFIQNGTEIISYRSLTEKQFCGNLLIAVSVGNQPDDIQLPFADVSGSIIKSVGRLQEFRDFGYDLCAEYGLAGVNRLKSWKNAGMILLQKITLCAEAEAFTIYSSSEKVVRRRIFASGNSPRIFLEASSPSIPSYGYPSEEYPEDTLCTESRLLHHQSRWQSLRYSGLPQEWFLVLLQPGSRRLRL